MAPEAPFGSFGCLFIKLVLTQVINVSSGPFTSEAATVLGLNSQSRFVHVDFTQRDEVKIKGGISLKLWVLFAHSISYRW